MPKQAHYDLRFGSRVKLKNNYIFISAPKEISNNISSGSLYIYQKTPGYYQRVKTLVPDGAEEGDYWATNIAFDGDTFLFTSYFALRNAGQGSERGVAYFSSVE